MRKNISTCNMAMRTVPKIYVRKLSLGRPRGKVWAEFDGVTKYELPIEGQ